MGPGDRGAGISLFGFTHSGATWLLNVLLELRICIYRGRFERFWLARRDGRLRVAERERIDLAVWYPRFQIERSYRFDPREPAVCWSHKTPSEAARAGRAIVVVRGPDDTLFSAYKRLGQGTSAERFLASPAFPELFGFEPALDWALYYALLAEAFPADRRCAVRFEDVKAADAVAHVSRVLAWMGIERTRPDIEAAVKASTFEVVKEASDRWYARYPHLRDGSWKAMRKGAVGEGRAELGPALEEALGGFPAQVASIYGYQSVSGRPPACVPAADAERVTATRAGIEALSLPRAGCPSSAWPVTALSMIHAAAAIARQDRDGGAARARWLVEPLLNRDGAPLGVWLALARLCRDVGDTGAYWRAIACAQAEVHGPADVLQVASARAHESLARWLIYGSRRRGARVGRTLDRLTVRLASALGLSWATCERRWPQV